MRKHLSKYNPGGPVPIDEQLPGYDQQYADYERNRLNLQNYQSDPRVELSRSAMGSNMPPVGAYNPNTQYNQYVSPAGYVAPPNAKPRLASILSGLNVGVRGISEKYARNRQDEYIDANIANPYSGILPYNDGQSDNVKYGYNNFKLGGTLDTMPDGGKPKPIITNDRNDPRLKAYNDSSLLYNDSRKLSEYVNSHKIKDNNEYWKAVDNIIDRKKEEKAFSDLTTLNKTPPTPIRREESTTQADDGIQKLFHFKKPIQEVIYKPTDKNPPYITNNPRDPRIKAYNDSMNLYKQGEIDREQYMNLLTSNNISTKEIEKYKGDMTYQYKKDGIHQFSEDKIKPVLHTNAHSIGSRGSVDHSGYDLFNDASLTTTTQIPNESQTLKNIKYGIYSYKKPVQQVKYQADATLQRQGYNPQLSTVSPQQGATIQGQASLIPQQQLDYRVQYTDPTTGQETHKDFLTEKQGSEFQKLLQGNREGSYKKYKYGGKMPDGGFIGPVQDIDMKGIMKSKMALASEFRNPSARRMTSLNPSTYTFTGQEMLNGQPAGVPRGESGTHFMGSYGNEARPAIQEVNGKMTFVSNPQWGNAENMQFDNEAQAQYFAEHYKDVAPMMKSRKFPDGGNVPADNFMRQWTNSLMHKQMLQASGGIGMLDDRIGNLNNANISTVAHKSLQTQPGVTRGRTDLNGNVEISDKLNDHSAFLTTNHELSHASDRGVLIPEMDRARLRNPTEDRARINSTRALGSKQGIYNPLIAPIDQGQYNKLLGEDSRDLKELLQTYGKDETFKLLNEVSSTKSNDGLTVAKKGGRMPKMVRGGISDVINFLYEGDREQVSGQTVDKKEKGAVAENTAPDDGEEQARYQRSMNIAMEAFQQRNPYKSDAQTPEEDQLTVEQVMAGIAGNEGAQTGQHTSLQGSALGKYQMINATRENIRKKYFGDMSPEEFEQQYKTNPSFEHQVARSHVQELMSKYGAAGAIESWYAGHPMNDNVVPGRSAGNKLTVGQYKNQALRRIGNNIKHAK